MARFQLDRTQSDWFGAYTSDNVASELTAMVCAQNIALRWPFPQKVRIRPDLQLSRTVAESLTTCRSNRCLAQVCRAQGLWLAKKAMVEEVRGHTGNPWNELADALAKHAMINGLNPMKHEFSALQHFATCNHDVNWSWMQTTHPAMTACFPPLVNQQVMSFPDPDRTIPIMPVERQCPPENTDAVRWQLHLKSANVLASEVRDIRSNGSKRTGQRTLRLDQQWHDAGTHVIGVQEARTQAGKTNTPHYMVLASGAKEARAPLYGCELWLHRTMPICHLPDGTPITFEQATVIVQHADPRRLFVEARLHHTVYSFAVLHAPCLGTQTINEISPHAIINQWWEETSLLCHKYLRSPLSWVLVDANAPLEHADNVHVGPHGAESAARHPRDFAAFLPAHGLLAPSTFAHFHPGQTTTWTHANGKRSRKDYVLLPVQSASLITASWVDIDHDNTFSHEDHLPVAVRCEGWISLPDTKRLPAWDEQALLDPIRCQRFRQALTSLPLPTWDVSVDDHAALYEKQLLTLGRQFFAKKPGKTRTVKLLPDTLAAVCFKRQILDLGRQTGEIRDPAFRAELKLVEKEVYRLVRRVIQSHYDSLIHQLQASGDIHDHRMVYRTLQKLGRKKGMAPNGPRPLPLLKMPSGETASTIVEQQHLWLQQFSQIEAGVVTTWDTLCSQHVAQKMENPMDLEPDAFPTAWDVQVLIAKLKRDKVPGPNMLPPALLKAGGEIAARHLSVLFAKASATAREPLLWKGGVLVPLWKGKQAPSLPEAYRSIFIFPTIQQSCITRPSASI